MFGGIDLLSDKQAGEVFKSIIEYVNGKAPQTKDPLVEMMLMAIIERLDKDLIKWKQAKNQATASDR